VRDVVTDSDLVGATEVRVAEGVSGFGSAGGAGAALHAANSVIAPATPTHP
jgi:hypothetical protein